MSCTVSDTNQLPPGDETAGVIVDVELEEAELDDHHDSQMISQLISEGEDDDIDQTRSKLRNNGCIVVFASCPFVFHSLFWTIRRR